MTALIAVLLFLLGDHSAPKAGPSGGDPSTQPAIPTGSEVTAPPIKRDAAADRSCPSTLAGLPVKLAGLSRRAVASSSGEYVVAWGEPPVIVQCGVPRPTGFVQTSQVIPVAGVQWFTPDQAPPKPPGTVAWTAVDRAVYVRVIIPTNYSADGVLGDVATAIRRAMGAQPLRPGK